MSPAESSSGARRLPTFAFLAVHLLIVVLVIAWTDRRAREQQRQRALPAFRAEPLAVEPLYDDQEVVSDEQLRRVLGRLGLRSRGPQTNIGEVDHSLRFWGADMRFDDPEVLSGDQMRQLLTDHSQFLQVLGADQAPLLLDDGSAIRYRTQEGLATSSHYDHTLASLAEVGTTLDFPIVTPRRRATVRSVLEQALLDFSLNQAEYEWSALVFALYLQPIESWFTSEGQRISFDQLARRVMREDLARGVCGGNHRLYTLTAFLRLDARPRAAGEPPLLSPETRQQIEAHLQDVTARFVRHQHADGFWNTDWPNSAPATSQPSDLPGDGIDSRLIVTGHVLEWWSLAPPELHPPRPVVTAAAQWLVKTVDGLSNDEIAEYYSFLSHIGRALALWRGRLPAEVELAP